MDDYKAEIKGKYGESWEIIIRANNIEEFYDLVKHIKSYEWKDRK